MVSLYCQFGPVEPLLALLRAGGVLVSNNSSSSSRLCQISTYSTLDIAGVFESALPDVNAELLFDRH